MLYKSFTYLMESFSVKGILFIILGIFSLFIVNSLNLIPINIPSAVSLLLNIVMMVIIMIGLLIFTGIAMIRSELNDQKRSNIN
ncbi:hypothetical protein ACFLRZ_03620 [Bacteroidota bacterium]